jgi:hypothetical protein
MRLKQKRSQVTIFLILGVVIVIVFVIVLTVSKNITKKGSRQETIEAKETVFDVQPINNFVEGCLSEVSKKGLNLIGKQGGYLFKSQGGSVIDYLSSDNGLFFINYEGFRTVYNIMRPRFKIAGYSIKPPIYPWKTFPYGDESKSEEKFVASGAFGVNTLPDLRREFGQQSMQVQLRTFVKNNIGGCLDFSLFEEQGFKIIRQDDAIIIVDITENNVVFKMTNNIKIESLVSGETTEIKNFLAPHNVRLGKIHQFVDKLIENDVGDIKFDILNNADQDFVVDIRNDAFNKDDIMIITDKKSSINNVPYQYYFGRQNRNPAIYYLTPTTIELPNLENITNQTLIAGYPANLIALDPDEDTIDLGSFSISPETPFLFILPKMEFRIEVTDGDLDDYQIINIIRKN